MSYKKLFKTLLLILLINIIMVGFQTTVMAISDRGADIQLKQRLDTVPEQMLSNGNIPSNEIDINLSHSNIGDYSVAKGHQIYDGGKWLLDNLSTTANTFGRSIAKIWTSLPDWARGLFKGVAVGLLAAIFIVVLVGLGVIGLAAAVAGIVAAIVGGIIYGLIVGGNNFNWWLGILVALSAGVTVAFVFEAFGLAIANYIRGLFSILGKYDWVKITARPFLIGGLVNLSSYLATRHLEEYSFWGIIGSFIIGGITGVLYGEAIMPWLQEAKYINFLSRLKWFTPLAKVLDSKGGRFFMLNVVGGGMMGAISTIVQNSFIGEKTSLSSIIAGIISGFLAATLIRTTYSGLTKALTKRMIKDVLDNGLTEFIKLKVQELLNKKSQKENVDSNVQRS